ncbi:MAG: hypothetical protein ACHQ49_08030 [Elusimicrobiota bacterium]
MAIIQGTKAAGPLKIAGAALLLGGSVALMVHRMPHHEYVAVHADKPRPQAADAAVPAVVAPHSPVAVPPPAAVAKSAPPPASAAAAKSTPPPLPPSQVQTDAPDAAPSPETPPFAEAATVDWRDECRPESGLLCFGISNAPLRRCLKSYDDVLLAPCRRALRIVRSSAAPSTEDESGN